MKRNFGGKVKINNVWLDMVSDITEKNWKKIVSPKINETLWKAVGVFVFKLKLLGEIKIYSY